MCADSWQRNSSRVVLSSSSQSLGRGARSRGSSYADISAAAYLTCCCRRRVAALLFRKAGFPRLGNAKFSEVTTSARMPPTVLVVRASRSPSPIGRGSLQFQYVESSFVPALPLLKARPPSVSAQLERSSATPRWRNDAIRAYVELADSNNTSAAMRWCIVKSGSALQCQCRLAPGMRRTSASKAASGSHDALFETICTATRHFAAGCRVSCGESCCRCARRAPLSTPFRAT
mmetsp:Transcript_46428/g.107947  ORF Transcript_46428/g.107947 Transcript_46428/m.107947 type:complete len:232 (+) Transcript_46428:249-944(+)